MTRDVLIHRPGVGRLGTAAAWISAVCCLPYLLLKVVWTLGIPVGISDRSLLDDPGWVVGNALMAVIQLAALGLVLALTRPWARAVPPWLLLFPVWMGTGMLFEVTVGALLIGLFSSVSQDSGTSTGGIQPWVYVVVYATFAAQGVAMAIAFACYVRVRWRRLLARRTDEVLATRTIPVRSWPERHLRQLAEVVAGMAAAVAVVFGYWAIGGSFGLSGTQSDASWQLHASRVSGALVAVLGLLGLAGRWGGQRRFWLPAALTWIGSGALAAFDGFWLMLNRVFIAFGDAGAHAWGVTDTMLVVKVAIGVSAAAVGVLAVTAAANHRPARHPSG